MARDIRPMAGNLISRQGSHPVSCRTGRSVCRYARGLVRRSADVRIWLLDSGRCALVYVCADLNAASVRADRQFKLPIRCRARRIGASGRYAGSSPRRRDDQPIMAGPGSGARVSCGGAAAASRLWRAGRRAVIRDGWQCAARGVVEYTIRSERVKERAENNSYVAFRYGTIICRTPSQIKPHAQCRKRKCKHPKQFPPDPPDLHLL